MRRDRKTGAVQRLSRRALLQGMALAGGGLVLAGCQGEPAAAPRAPAAPALTDPPASGSGTDWEAQWNQLVEGAKREGVVVVSGPPTPAVRTELAAAFRRRFGIELEYLGGRTGDLMTRLQSERQAGQYTLDAMLAGAQSIYTIGYPQQMYDPLLPALVHPEATDPASWIGGHQWFMDPQRQTICGSRTTCRSM